MHITLLFWLNAACAAVVSARPGESIHPVVELDSNWQPKDKSRLNRRSGQAARVALSAFAKQGIQAQLSAAVPFTTENDIIGTLLTFVRLS